MRGFVRLTFALSLLAQAACVPMRENGAGYEGLQPKDPPADFNDISSELLALSKDATYTCQTSAGDQAVLLEGQSGENRKSTYLERNSSGALDAKSSETVKPYQQSEDPGIFYFLAEAAYPQAEYDARNGGYWLKVIADEGAYPNGFYPAKLRIDHKPDAVFHQDAFFCKPVNEVVFDEAQFFKVGDRVIMRVRGFDASKMFDFLSAGADAKIDLSKWAREPILNAVAKGDVACSTRAYRRGLDPKSAWNLQNSLSCAFELQKDGEVVAPASATGMWRPVIPVIQYSDGMMTAELTATSYYRNRQPGEAYSAGLTWWYSDDSLVDSRTVDDNYEFQFNGGDADRLYSDVIQGATETPGTDTDGHDYTEKMSPQGTLRCRKYPDATHCTVRFNHAGLPQSQK